MTGKYYDVSWLFNSFMLGNFITQMEQSDLNTFSDLSDTHKYKKYILGAREII